MDRLNTMVLLALLASCFAMLAGVTRAFSIDTSNSNDPNSNYFTLNSRNLDKDGQCVRETKISGHGIKDTFESRCSLNGESSLISDSRLIYGNPKEENTLLLYSEMPNTLIVRLDGKCTKRIYTVTGLNAKSTSSPLTDSECAEIKQKAEDEIEKNRIYWEEWNKNFQAHMASVFGNSQNTVSDVSVDGGDDDGTTDDDESNNESENTYNEDLETDNEKPDGQEEETNEDFEDDVNTKPEQEEEDGNQVPGLSISDYWADWGRKMEERTRKAFPPGFPFHKKNM